MGKQVNKVDAEVLVPFHVTGSRSDERSVLLSRVCCLACVPGNGDTIAINDSISVKVVRVRLLLNGSVEVMCEHRHGCKLELESYDAQEFIEKMPLSPPPSLGVVFHSDGSVMWLSRGA